MSEPAPPPPVRLVIECRTPAELLAFAPGPRFEGAPWLPPSMAARIENPPLYAAPAPVPLGEAAGYLVIALAALLAWRIRRIAL